MSKSRIIYIEGPKGVGKSYFGERLATRLDWPFRNPRYGKELGRNLWEWEDVTRSYDYDLGYSTVAHRGMPSAMIYNYPREELWNIWFRNMLLWDFAHIVFIDFISQTPWLQNLQERGLDVLEVAQEAVEFRKIRQRIPARMQTVLFLDDLRANGCNYSIVEIERLVYARKSQRFF